MYATKRHRFAVLLLSLVMAGCVAQNPPVPQSGLPGRHTDPTRPNSYSGIGVEADDLIVISDKMVRSILQAPQIAGRANPPRVIIDSTAFVNESNQILNMNAIMDQLRVNLLRSAMGRIIFVSRENIGLVEGERKAKTEGVIDAGTLRKSEILGADYRLVGRLSSQSTIGETTGVKTNYFVFAFELLDLNDSRIAWADVYDVQKQGADDVIYR